MHDQLPKLTQHISYSPLIFIVALLLGVTIHIFLPVSFTHHTLRALVLGGFLLAVAPLILVWASGYRATAYCAECTQVHKLGTGPYQFSRHPKYVAFLFLIIGMGFVMNSVILFVVAALLFLVFTLFLIPREEKILSQIFGPEHAAYIKHVPMWL